MRTEESEPLRLRRLISLYVSLSGETERLCGIQWFQAEAVDIYGPNEFGEIFDIFTGKMHSQLHDYPLGTVRVNAPQWPR